MQPEKIIISLENEGKRLDAYLAAELEEHFSRSQLKKLIEEGGIRVGGKNVSAHYKTKAGDVVDIDWPERRPDETPAQDIPLEILHEDEDLLLINKPPGMVVHPAHGNPDKTLVNALLFHSKKLSGRNGIIRPGIVHRLDKDTSGIMVIAKSDKVHDFLARQFKNQTIERIYRVAVKGIVQHEEGICEEPVGRAFLNRKKIIVKPSGGKDACTYFRVLKRYARATLLELKLQTGRTHQIRVHMRHLGYPVLGDELYGVTSPYISRQAVHAFSLGFIHPRTKQQISKEAALPEDFQRLLSSLESEKNLPV